jgi:hypothetical protein
MHTLSTSTGLGFAHFGALAGVGKASVSEPHVSASQNVTFG